MKKENISFPCFKTIYNWLYSGFLTKIKASNLRHKGKSLKRKANFQIAEINKRAIWKRDKFIKKRARIGNWEIVNVVSRGGSKAWLLTIVDRKSRVIITSEQLKQH